MDTRILFAAALALVILSSSEATARDFDITVDADGAVSFTTGDASVMGPVDNTPDARSEWRFDNALGSINGSITFEGFWNVTHPRQPLPKIDGTYFAEWHGDPTDGAREDENFTNVTGTVDRQVFLFSFAPNTVTSARTLLFEKDTTPPGYTLGEITNITHYSFLIVTNTTEPALADLLIRPMAGGEYVINPTPFPARRQNFPVQGLQPATTYDFTIEFWDFSMNHVKSEVLTMTTARKPTPPPPILLSLFPEDNASLPKSPDAIRARVVSPNVPLVHGDVRLILDLKEYTPNSTFDGANFTYVPDKALAAGLHKASLDVTDSAGGFLRVIWRFTVEPQRVPGFEVALLASALACAATVLRRRV
ncbi:MAG: hypothetical protein HY556_08635 [Euryarchaeota archaeon]|nr:hypothetical protein [Euryarchaeota archaeon]